jgi:hypothetical protein
MIRTQETLTLTARTPVKQTSAKAAATSICSPYRPLLMPIGHGQQRNYRLNLVLPKDPFDARGIAASPGAGRTVPGRGSLLRAR